MQYQVLQHIKGREFVPVIDDTTNTPLIFGSAHEAAEHASKLTKERGVKFQPRPIKPANDWRKREQERFANGNYKHVLWVNEKWFQEHCIQDHFVHIADKDPKRLAYTRDAEKGAADVKVLIKPGKYLQDFFSNVLTAEEITKYAMQHALQFEHNEIKWAYTPEEIQKAYEPRLGSSCFSDSTKANLYGSGDFAVAYITDETGKITARAVVALKPKMYPRAYGDYYRLEDLLQKAGFKKKGRSDDYKGLRILKKWHWEGFYSDFYTEDYDYYSNRNWRQDPADDRFLVLK